MTIKDIIKNDSDRLFVIDRECFIIFTGSSLEDDKPFIRMGNYIDLPVDLIPLVENIVITDLLVGNPAYEQFNIDIKYLSSNRYIGSKHIVKKYLDFQKSFDLDLKNATIVNIDKDIPYLSKEKELSDRNSFIGIFYTDGNFMIKYHKHKIIDLRNIIEESFDDIKIHNIISQNVKGNERYDGSGIIIINNNPLFYRNGFFTTYHFPKTYYEEFLRLGIDPVQIREIIHPSSNIIHIMKLLKWKNSLSGRIKIFSNHVDIIDYIQGLFTDSTIQRKDFSNFKYETGDGLNINNYPDSYNIRLVYKKVKPSLDDITVTYVKGISGLKAVIKEKQDAILINYSVFEEASLLFKSTAVPIVVIDDGNKNISRLKGNNIIMHQGVQYDFRRYDDINKVVQDFPVLTEKDITQLSLTEINTLKSNMIKSSKSRKDDFEGFKEMFNIISLFKLLLGSSSDRKRSSAIRKTINELERVFDSSSIISFSNEADVALVFCNNNVYEFIQSAKAAPIKDNTIIDEINDNDISLYKKHKLEYYVRIVNDRERLRRLLALFISKGRKEHAVLKKAIYERKDRYYTNSMEVSIDELKKSKKSLLKGLSSKINKGGKHELDNRDSEEHKALRMLRLKRIAAVIIVIVSIAIIILVSRKKIDDYIEYKKNEKIIQEKKFKEMLVGKYNIYVSDDDIFKYANEVAVKNGYNRITKTSLKKNNPNWIYPGNVFILLDGDRVVVKNGDTLWDISHKKLIQKHIEFYKLIEEIDSKIKTGINVKTDIDKAKGLAFNAKHQKILLEINNRIEPGRK